MAYVGLCKALYDYQSQSPDELSLVEDQVIYILNDDDPEWWSARIRRTNHDGTPIQNDSEAPSGLVPSNYVEAAEPLRLSRALYDYQPQNSDELDVEEDELLRVYETDGLWLLVRKQGADELGDGQGKLGYVPANYVDEVEAPDTGEVPVEVEAEEEEDNVAPSGATIPMAPPTGAGKQDKADAIKMWAVSALDSKKKKKKGTLGIGNASLFFASESDKTPVQKISVSHILSHSLESKGKQLHLSLSSEAGIQGDELIFNTGSKDVGEEIAAKIDQSKDAAETAGDVEETSASAPTKGAGIPPPPPLAGTSSSTLPPPSRSNAVLPPPQRKTVSFQAQTEPEEEEAEVEEETNQPETNGHSSSEGESAIALYDFDAQGDDELSVKENEELTVVEKENEDWWKVRNSSGQEGVVPASYVEMTETTPATSSSIPTPPPPPPVVNGAASAAAKAKAAKEAEEARRREEEEEAARAEAEAEEEADRQAAEAAIAERRRKKAEEDQKRRDALKAQSAPAPPKMEERRAPEPQKEVKVPSGKSAPERPSGGGSKSKPAPKHTRIWHDRTGQFKVEAEFLGFNQGKIRLHKLNGVIIEVAIEKMSDVDIQFLEEVTGKRLAPRQSSSSNSKEMSLAHAVEQRRREGPGGGSYNERERERQKAKEREREKERERRHRQGGGGGGGTASSSRPSGSSSKRNIDWFEFFLAASVDVDDCTRYAAAFERDKIDEAILPELDPSTLRTLGLREGDIIRVRKFIDRKYKPQGSSSRQNTSSDPASQLKSDEEMARRLQEQETAARRGNSTSPAPGLFSGPDGGLKNNTRRGRPTPTSKTSSGVDAASLAAASESLARTATPPTRTSTTSPEIKRVSSAQATRSPTTTIASGFDDDAWTPRPSSAKPSTPAPPVVAASIPTAPPAPPAAPTPPVAPPAVVAEPPKPPADPNSALFDKLAAMKPPSGGSISPRPGASPANGSMLNNNNSFNPNAPRGPLAPVPGNQGLLQPLISTQGTGQFVPTGMQPQQTGWNGMQQPQMTGFAGGMGGAGGQHQQPQMTGLGGMGMSSPPSAFGMNGMVSQQTGFPGMNSGIQSQQTGWGGMQQQQQPQMTSNVSGFGLPQQQQQQQQPQQQQQQDGSKFAASNIFAQMKSGQFAKDPNSSAQSSDKYDALRPQPTGFAPGGVQPPQGMGINPQQTGYLSPQFTAQPGNFGMYGQQQQYQQGQGGFGYQY